MVEAYKNICDHLNRHQVEYLVIGGVAVIAYGYPRSTGDVDFWYRPTTKNYIKLLSTFKDIGVDVSSLDNVVFDPEKSFLRIPTLGIKAEFLPQVKGLAKFEEAYQRAKMFSLDGINIPIIGYHDLIATKRETNRPKDLGDIDELEKRRKGSDNSF